MAQLASKISGLFVSKPTGDANTPKRYLELTKKCMERAQKMTSSSVSTAVKFNFEQCKYLVDKLKLAFESAHKSFVVLLNRGYFWFPSPFDTANCLEIFKQLYTLAKEVVNFIQSCCKDAWIPAALTLTNVLDYISSLGFSLELCRRVFCESKVYTALRRSLTPTEVERVFIAEVEVVKGKASLDLETLSRKLHALRQTRKSSSTDYQLTALLLERLERARLIPAGHSPGPSQARLSETLIRSLKQMEILGRGCAAIVYRATWLGAEVAKKTFYGPCNPHFEREVSTLAGLSHPNIASLLCYGKNMQECSIIMELMDEDLFNLMQRRRQGNGRCDYPFSILEAVDIMLQVAGGMHYLHEMRIVHRDLKSMNILVKRVKASGLEIEYILAKVADFGMSKTKERSMTFSLQTVNMGTTRWMAPEMIQSRNPESQEEMSNGEAMVQMYPFKSDVYSFGMVCYEILSGHQPFSSTSNQSDVKKMVLDGERPVLPGGYPPLLIHLIERCWSPDASKRPCFGVICAELRHLKCLLLMPSVLEKGISTSVYSRMQPPAELERAEERAAMILSANDGRAPPPVKWLVALDIGTTYSGFAYTIATCPGQTLLCHDWPRKGHDQRPYCKALTATFYKNMQNGSDGFSVSNFNQLVSKDLIHPSLIARSPHPAVTVDTIIMDILKHIGELALTQIKNLNHLDLRRFCRDSVQWCVAVPSIWDENAKQRIKECMMNAELVSGEGGMDLAVKFVLKPEAASFHCHQLLRLKYDWDLSLQVKDEILVVDIGGVTVDIVVQVVVASGNAFKVQELTAASDCCGGKLVDESFMRFLSRRTSGCLDKFLRPGKTVPSHRLRLLKDWEHIKCVFGQEMMSDTDSYEIALHDELGAKWKAYEEEHGYNRWTSYAKIELNQQDLEFIFDPVVDEILELIAKQLARVEGIKVMFVVGGFAGSAYLMQRIRGRFCGEVDHIFSPPDPGSAVMEGAIALALTQDALGA